MYTAAIALRKNIFTAALIALLMGLFIFPAFTFAASCKTNSDCTVKGEKCDPISKTCTKDSFGLNPVDKGLGGTLGNQDLRTTIGNVINVALSLLGVVAVVIILIGGFKWMTAGGNEEKVGEARKIIFQGIIGLAIILSAWAIAIFVLNSLSSATGSGSTDLQAS